MCEPTKMGNFENYIPIDTNGKNLEQCTDIPRKGHKILKLLQCAKRVGLYFVFVGPPLGNFLVVLRPSIYKYFTGRRGT